MGVAFSRIPRTERAGTGLRRGAHVLPAAVFPYAAAGLAASLAQVVGGWWDVAWHAALGRETFWSPPHLLIYAGLIGLLVVVASGLARPAARGPTRAAFAVAALGPFAQLAAAPFDELWHRLYGIDVTIWSPPHLVLLAGMALAPLGLGLALAADAGDRPVVRGWQWVALGLFAVALTVATGALGDLAAHVWTRGPQLYPALAGGLLAPILIVAAVAIGPWASATAAVALFTALYLALDLVFGALLPHAHPPGPPPILLFPALLADTAVAARGARLEWWRVGALGLAFGPFFVVVDGPISHAITAAQWPQIAVYRSGPFPSGAPRPQLPPSVPWLASELLVAAVVGAAAGLLGTAAGHALSRVFGFPCIAARVGSPPE